VAREIISLIFLGQLRRTFRFWTIDTCKTLYCAYVRPHLEYASSVWSPCYEDRLTVLGLTPLHERRIRGDLIQLFKFNNGFNEVSWVNLSLLQCSSLSQTGPARGIRGHKRRLSGQPSTKCMQKSNFFTNRVVNHWNALAAEVTDSQSINQFKNKYDVFKSNL